MNKWERKLYFQKNKGKLIKRGTIVLSVLLLVVGVIYITYSKFESNKEFTLINGKVVNNGDVQIISYEYDGEKHNEPPAKNTGYVNASINCTNAIGEWKNDEWGLMVTNITGKVKCDLKFTRNYSITYNLNGGTCSDCPTSYTSETNTFVLPAPTKTGYSFTGWTGSNGTAPQRNVTISNGTTGDKSYTANFAITPVYLYNQGNENTSLTGGWVASQPASGSASKNSNYLEVYAYVAQHYSDAGTASMCTSNYVDITKFTSATFNYSYNFTWNAAGKIYAVPESSSNSTINFHNKEQGESSQNFEGNKAFDLSSYNGNYKFCIWVYGSATGGNSGTIKLYSLLLS